MISTVEDFYSGASTLLERFNEFAHTHTLINEAVADHICYKCGSSESFEKMRAIFEMQSDYMYQSIISQRRIAYIRFKTPLPTSLGNIWYLELSDQKPDGSQCEGFDHIEVYSTRDAYVDMVEKLKTTETVVHVERPHHTTDDVDMGNGFLFRCSPGPLIEKIKADEIH